MHPASIPPQQRRENPEPSERSRPVPWAMLLMVALMAAFGAGYIATDASPAAPEFGDQRAMAELRATTSAAGSDQAVDGAAVYAARCAACHQISGAGVPGAFPPLAGSEWLAGNPRRLVALVLHGVTGPITVKGTTYSGAMPAFAQQLGDAEIAALLTDLRATWGAGASAVTRDTVAQVRTDTQARTAPFNGESELKGFE